MNLPLNVFPNYTITLPISKEIVKFRPWVSIENKALMTSMISKDREEIIAAIMRILRATTFDEILLEELPSADVEYLFVKVKAKSKGEIVELTYSATEERDGINDIIPVELNLEDVEVTPLPEKNISLGNGIGVVMKFPSFEIASLIDSLEDEYEKMAYLIDYVYDESKIYSSDDVSKKELADWLRNLLDSQLDKIVEFTSRLPTIKVKIVFTIGIPPKEKEIELVGLHDFFL